MHFAAAAVFVFVVVILCLLLAAYCSRSGSGRAWRGGGPSHERLGGSGAGSESAAKAKATANAKAKTRAQGRSVRGTEVDRAAAAAPTALLAKGLPPGLLSAFDLTGGEVAPTDWGVGLYAGIWGRDDPGRSTLLTPSRLARAAVQTSGRVYAWCVYDSPECCYAVRAEPVNGRVFELDQDALIGWIRQELVGSPPHKLPLRSYLRHLRGLGLVVAEGPHRDVSVRFDLVDVTTPAERAATTASLLALTEEDFLALNWKDYDGAVHAAACALPHEVGGDVAIDLDRGRVSAPKVRPGNLYSSHPLARSFVTFHTHPAGRFRGGSFEPPSSADVRWILHNCSRLGQVWHFVTAPEGTYIVRPSAQLARWYSDEPARAEGAAVSLYSSGLQCLGGVLVCARAAVRALRDAGFVAFFREHPCRGFTFLDRPDLTPGRNSADARLAAAEVDAARRLSGAELLGADWLAVLRATDVPGLSPSSWTRASWSKGRLALHDGHHFGDPADSESYPVGFAGPIVIFTFEPDAFPRALPPAAVEAARSNAASWPWLVFLCRDAVLAFRHTSGLEVYGPRPLAAGPAPRRR